MKTILIAILMFIALSTGAKCDIITVVGDSGIISPGYMPQTANQKILIPKFNPTLGNLSHIVLEFDISFYNTSRFTNNENGPRTLAYFELATVGISDKLWDVNTSSSAYIQTEGNNSFFISKSNADGNYSFTNLPYYPTNTVRIQPYGSIRITTLEFSSSQRQTVYDLAAFVGNGDMEFYLGSVYYLFWGDSWAISREDQATVRGVVSAEYYYTPVPIPGAVWLLGSGLLGLLGIKKKLQSR